MTSHNHLVPLKSQILNQETFPKAFPVRKKTQQKYLFSNKNVSGSNFEKTDWNSNHGKGWEFDFAN